MQTCNNKTYNWNLILENYEIPFKILLKCLNKISFNKKKK